MEIDEFVKMIKQSQKIVIFTGAGLSTASGLSDFKHAKGFFDKQNGELHFGPEILSLDCLKTNPRLFFDYFNERIVSSEAKPNFGHQFFKKLEEEFGKDIQVITQNIDNLHTEMNYSEKVLELHGNTRDWSTIKVRRPVLVDNIFYKEGLPYEKETQEPVRPDIVLYGESLNQRTYTKSEHVLFAADMLIVLGTELGVFPAASLLHRFQGTRSVYINKTTTTESLSFRLFFEEDIVTVLELVYEKMIK